MQTTDQNFIHLSARKDSSSASEDAGRTSPPESPGTICAALFQTMNPAGQSAFFRSAGLERMHAKADIILKQMIRHGIRHAFLSRLFEAYGYPRNRTAMTTLFDACIRYDEKKFDSHLEAVLWGESALLPTDATRDGVQKDILPFVKTLWEEWWPLRTENTRPPVWNRGRTRPVNTPERRIAALCAFLMKNGTNPLPGWIAGLNRSADAKSLRKKLEESFRSSDPYWDSHATFTAPAMKHAAAVTGASQARELLTDTAVPCLRAALLLNKAEAKQLDRLDALYLSIPKTQDQAVLKTACRYFFSDPARAEKQMGSAAERQGMLHIYRNFCETADHDCEACLLPRSSRIRSGKGAR